MKKIIVLLAAAIICFSATCRAEWPADEIVEKCDPFYLKSMDPAYLRILRNAVYATYGRAFQSEDLKAYFANEDWYSEKPDFSEDMLSAPEKACAGVIKQVEDEQAAKIAALRGKGRVPDVSLLPNIHLFGDLDARTRELLQSNGFALLPTREEQLFHIYEKNAYQRIPSFVTSDLVLQLYHAFFDASLKSIEEKNLLPQLEQFVSGMYTISATLAGKDAPDTLARARKTNAGYFAVASLLLEQDIDLSLLDPDTRAAVDREMELLKKHEKREKSNLFPYQIDYSQFIPRGHYTRSKNLKRYFLSMMWLGNTLFALAPDKEFARDVTSTDTDFLIVRALDIAHVMKTGKAADGIPLPDLWHAIYDISEFFVGASDDLTPEQVYAIGVEVYGQLPDPGAYADAAKIAQVREVAQKKNPARIRQQFLGSPNGVQMRVMGQRYIPDSEMLQRLSQFPERPIPKGLDVMAVLGSDTAKKLLFDVYKEGEKWEEYGPRFEALKKDFSKLTPEEWRQNMYFGWLWSLQALVADRPAGKAIPWFATTPAWDMKNLNTSLASWAELRHDTLLYAKQSVTAECGDASEFVNPPKPRGYVEPNAEFFRRLEMLTELSMAGLERFGYLDASESGEDYDYYPLKSKYEMLLELLTFLKNVSEKQFRGEPLTEDEADQINVIGGVVERLTLTLFEPSPQYWELVSDVDRFMAVVADVHTQGNNILEAAVGYPSELLVIVPVDGVPMLMRGAVFSYYEFVNPQSNRLTDEAWQQMLKEDKAPDPPEWIKAIFNGVFRKAPEGKIFYSSGC